MDDKKKSIAPDRHGRPDNRAQGVVVGSVIPAPGNPSPHATRDKTEAWDFSLDRPVPPVDSPTILSVKDTNPKDAVGTKKWRQYCTIPTTILWELGVAMLEGARKYGRHNYRIAGVRASVYVDAAKGHIDQWWEGEDIDEESKLNHLVKAIASLVVLRDAMIQNKWVDDRPPKTDLDTLRKDLQEAVDGIFERIPEAKDAYLEGDQYGDNEAKAKALALRSYYTDSIDHKAYPTSTRYVDEWWEERFLPIVLKRESDEV